MVRGVILDLTPGHETTGLLVSPEGWLIILTEIEDAEEGRLKEPPWCFTKSQFGPVEGHVALVEMFAALKREFLPDLHTRDERVADHVYLETVGLSGVDIGIVDMVLSAIGAIVLRRQVPRCNETRQVGTASLRGEASSASRQGPPAIRHSPIIS